MTYTAHEDNAGGTHISDGGAAWFLGFGYQGDLAADLAAWASGDWEPSEDDGQTPETISEYEASAGRTDSTRNRGGRPRIGDQVKIAVQPDILARVDEEARAARVSRSEWIRRAIVGALPPQDPDAGQAAFTR